MHSISERARYLMHLIHCTGITLEAHSIADWHNLDLLYNFIISEE